MLAWSLRTVHMDQQFMINNVTANQSSLENKHSLWVAYKDGWVFRPTLVYHEGSTGEMFVSSRTMIQHRVTCSGPFILSLDGSFKLTWLLYNNVPLLVTCISLLEKGRRFYILESWSSVSTKKTFVKKRFYMKSIEPFSWKWFFIGLIQHQY